MPYSPPPLLRVMVPTRPAHLLPRQHLRPYLERIKQVRIVAITAPAGFGKTSVLIDAATDNPPLPVAWYTLGDGDDDIWQFLTCLVEAIRQPFPNFGVRTRQALGQNHKNWPDVCQILLGEMSLLPEFLLFLDDFHIVGEQAMIADLISTMAAQCPSLHMVLASRSIPRLPQTMQMVARRQLFGLDFEALRFTVPEAQRLLQQLQYVISEDQLAELVEKMDGWITGVLLAVQATHGERSPAQLLAALGDQPVYSFLAEQVLMGLPAELQDFLQVTSLLDVFTVEEADNMRQADDSAYLLDEAVRRGLFVSSSANGFRYHPQLREFLRTRFKTYEQLRYVACARRLAALAEASGDWLRAFDVLADIGARGDMVRLLSSTGTTLFHQGRVETLRRLLAYLSLDELNVPLLCLKASAELHQGRWRDARVLMELADARAQAGERSMVQLLHARVALHAGEFAAAIEGSRRLLDLTSDPASRAEALRTLGMALYRGSGDYDAALTNLREALNLFRELGDVYNCAVIRGQLGTCYGNLGDLANATAYLKDADATWRVLGNDSQRAMTLNNLAVLLHMAGSYSEAAATLQEAAGLAQSTANPGYQALIAISQGDLLSDMQRWDEAGAAYARARRLEQHLPAPMRTLLAVSIAHVERRRRRYDASAAALSVPQAEGNNPSVVAARGMLAAARADYTAAAALLEQAAPALQERRSWIELARVRLFQAWSAYNVRASSELVLDLLQEAARLADTHFGHDRFLQVELAPMRAMLRLAAGQGMARAQSWLLALGVPANTPPIEAGHQRVQVSVLALGEDLILLDGEAISLGWRKAREVLYFLLQNGNSATPEQIREAVWPDDDGINALKSAVYQLRRVLPASLLPTPRSGRYMIDTDQVQLDYDVARFNEYAERRDEEGMLDALQLYRGPYLMQVSSTWCRRPRLELAQQALDVHYALAGYYERQSRFADALSLYRSVIGLDHAQARAYTGAMRCHIALGDRGAALDSYTSLARMTYELHGITLPPDDEAERLYRQLIKS